VSALHKAANALQSLPLPYTVVREIEEELDAVGQLAAEIVDGTSAAQALLSTFDEVRRDGPQFAVTGLDRLAETLRRVAGEIRDAPGPTSTPPPTSPTRVTRAALLHDRARDRHTDKDIESGLRSVETLGYGVERRRNGHFNVHCPCGHCAPVIISSTPRRNDVALALLRQTAARGCHTGKKTS
jgi:hypothetical protein